MKMANVHAVKKGQHVFSGGACLGVSLIVRDEAIVEC
jgi:hypothetical protein